MKNITNSLLLIFLLCISAFAQATITVEAVGYGTTKDAAYQDAIRNAVAEAVGVLVESTTIVSKGELIEDQVLTRSVGYVSSVKLLFDFDAQRQMIKISADIDRSGVESAIQRLQVADDGGIKVDGQSAYAAAISNRQVFDQAIATGKARTDAIFNELLHSVNIQLTDVAIDTRAVGGQVAYQLAFTQTVNQMQYSSAIRKLGELCTELWAEKTPYLGGEIPLNAIVLTNIDNTSVMYTFDYQYDGRAALDVLDNLFLKLHAMNGNSSSFTVLIMNAEKQIIDANQRVANNNSYFLTGDMRILTPNFTGRAAYTHTDRIDLANLRDFDSLNIINTAPLAGTGIELTSVSPVKLGNMFLAGQGFKQNKAEAAYWYFKDILRTAPAGAKVGFVPFALGLYFYGGKDQAEAVAWWRKAAEQGNSDAQYYLGYAYQRGEGIARDTSEAVRWYTLAAQQGNEAAQRALTQLPAERGN